MFSCCACTRPSKLDTEEVKSDETSDSDDDDDSLEEDEKSENDDESSDEETSNNDEDDDDDVTKKIKDDRKNSSLKTETIENGNSTKLPESSPQNSSTSTEILSQKIPLEGEGNFHEITPEMISSPTNSQSEEVEYAEILPKSLSPVKDDSELQSEEIETMPTVGKIPPEGDYSTIVKKVPVPEKVDEKSPEETSNKVVEPKKLREQIFQREMSQSFDDEDPSPENSSNTGSVVHIPSSIPDNEIITPKIDIPLTQEEIIEETEKQETQILEENIPSPENQSEEIIAECSENIIPPPEVEDYGQPPDIDEIIQPPDDENFSLPSENTFPPSETDDYFLSKESENFLPPEILPPEDILPPKIDDILPPKMEDILPPKMEDIPPPKLEDILPLEMENILPPETEDILPAQRDFLPPQATESEITENLIPPQDYEDFIPPPQSEIFLPPPDNEEFLPPPVNEIMTSPSPENLLLNSQKSPSFDSDVPSPQNTWTSSSTDEEKRAIEITEFIGIAGNLKRDKSPLHHAPAYIERTLDDGPEDEGDDSVFESYPTPPPPPDIDFDTNKKSAVPPPIPQWLSQEDDDENISEGYGGMQEPPATPVARDELALRRHRFFSDLLQATRNSAEHRVSFDPLGPTVHLGCESDERDEHLEELVTRLENVTRRLERVPQGTPETQEIAVQTKTPSPEKSPSPKKSLKDSISSEDQCSQGSTSSISSAASSIVEINNMSVAGYEDIVAGPVQEFLALSQKIGGDVNAHSQLVDKAFQIQLAFIKMTSTRPAPVNQTEQVTLLGPTSTQIQQIQEFRDKHRASPFFNHLSAISESIPALGWVAVSPTPAPYVKEMNDAGQFYTNRVLKDWKEKDKTHVDWCKAWIQVLSELNQYVRKHHTTGLVWAKGGAVPPPPAGVPPPPPCMPLGDVAPVLNDDRSALFAEINQGENITRNLKKVTSEMQTHKNPNIRTGPAPFKAPVTANSGSPMKTTLPANAPIDKPPVFTRDGKKWLVEYHKGNKNLLVENAEMNNVIYMFRCQESTLVVKGKVNSVVMDSCRKSSVIFDSLVSSIEFVNCQSVQMQVFGKVPTISVDKTDGCQMYLSPDSMDVAIISSKSSEMNVMIPKGNGDYTELPVPEQFKTTVSPKGLSTVAVDSLG